MKQKEEEKEAAQRGGAAAGSGPSSVQWPKQGAIIDERCCAGLFARSFPTLFPRGTGDLTNPDLAGSISLEDWAQYLMRHSCGRFARHPRYRPRELHC